MGMPSSGHLISPYARDKMIASHGWSLTYRTDRLGIQTKCAIHREQRLILERIPYCSRDITKRSYDGAGENDLSNRSEREKELRIGAITPGQPMMIRDSEQCRRDRQRCAKRDRFETKIGGRQP